MMVAETDVLLNPIGEPEVVKHDLAPRLNTIKGRVGGFLDNNKVNSDVFLARVQELMVQQHGLAGSVAYQKPDTGRPTPSEMVEGLATGCAFVVHAHAD
ncbi:MAG: hypothetical protein ABIH46_08855 [Chloroflexota bacterium]